MEHPLSGEDRAGCAAMRASRLLILSANGTPGTPAAWVTTPRKLLGHETENVSIMRIQTLFGGSSLGHTNADASSPASQSTQSGANIGRWGTTAAGSVLVAILTSCAEQPGIQNPDIL